MGGKVYGMKKSKERREEPLGTMSYQTSSKRSPPFWLLNGTRKLVFFWHQSEARTAATVWNWSGKTLSPGALLAVLYFSLFHIYSSACLDFPSPPLSAPRSPRMFFLQITQGHRSVRYNTDLPPPPPFKFVPPSFEDGLVVVATLIRVEGGSQAQDHGQAIYAKIRLSVSSTFATGCNMSNHQLHPMFQLNLITSQSCH